MDFNINIDGASRGNPGPASAGVVVRDRATGKPIHEAGYLLGQSTNNVAEYNGLLRGLEVIAKIPREPSSEIHLHSDSQLMVKQIIGEYRVKSADLQPLVAEAQSRLRKLGNKWKINYVPREQNKRADELANMALDAGRDVIVLAGDGSTATPSSPVARASAAVSPSTIAAAPGSLFTARLTAAPGAQCPAHTPAKTPFAFGPKTPANFCIFATQAVFDEDPTLWRESKTTEAQTQCAKCGVSIEIVRSEK